MPQLDKVTFLSQFFWLCFFYLGFYFFIYKFFLPKMSRILKFRKQKMNLSHHGVATTQQENEKVCESYDTLVSQGLNTSKILFGNASQRTNDWVRKTSHDLNETQLQNVNKTYIISLGETTASEVLALQQSSLRIPQNSFFSLFLTKMDSFSSNVSASAKKLSAPIGTSLSSQNNEDKKRNQAHKTPGFTEEISNAQKKGTSGENKQPQQKTFFTPKKDTNKKK